MEQYYNYLNDLRDSGVTNIQNLLMVAKLNTSDPWIQAKEKPELFDWWISNEMQSGHQWKKEISYEALRSRSQNQIGLWDGDKSFECFCNID